MKLIILSLIAMSSFTAYAAPGAITGLAGYGTYRSLGAESIAGLTKQIEYLCIVKRKGTLLSPVECTGFTDSLNFRLCSAVCSVGGNAFIQFDGSAMGITKE